MSPLKVTQNNYRIGGEMYRIGQRTFLQVHCSAFSRIEKNLRNISVIFHAVAIERKIKQCICLSYASLVVFCWLETSQFVLWYHRCWNRKVPINTLINITTQNLIIPACISINIYDSIILPGLLTEEFNSDGVFLCGFWLGGDTFVNCWMQSAKHISPICLW